MANDLQLFTTESIPGLVSLYNDAYVFARQVGDLDWIYPFPEEILAGYINDNELFGLSEQPGEIQSSVRLYETLTSQDVLFVGKLAVARSLKGSGFSQKKLLPAIIDIGQDRDKKELRLTCLAHNQRLVNFYIGLGFVEIDERLGQADAGYEVRIKELSLELK